MKQLWFAMSLVTGSLLFSANASATPASGALLQQMNLASQSLNYELSFISINKQGVESLRYRHARLDNRPLAQLLQMDGPRREVVQRGNEISYFEPGLEPFTLNGDYIVDSLPSLIYTDFKRLSPYYDFISVGRTRIADRLCEVIRVVARDGTRYSYIVWMDTESKLPMRVDLLDRDGETLEQFRVIAFNVNQDISSSMQTLAKANLPPLLSVPVGEKAKFSWTPTWLPQGFSEVSSSRRPLPTMDNMPIESRLYSDGLFSFSVNVNRATPSSTDQMLRTGRRTVSTSVRDNAEITIVVPCDEPLVPGQKVELGIAEGSLLSSALLVYMSPLVGLFLIASLFQLLFASDVAALCGAILGGIGGFLIARGYSRKFAARAEWQPIILSVALPPGLVRFETSSEDASQ